MPSVRTSEMQFADGIPSFKPNNFSQLFYCIINNIFLETSKHYVKLGEAFLLFWKVEIAQTLLCITAHI